MPHTVNEGSCSFARPSLLCIFAQENAWRHIFALNVKPEGIGIIIIQHNNYARFRVNSLLNKPHM